jgi:hypothetical protein
VQHGGGRPHPAARHPGMWCSLLPLLSCTCNSLPLPGSCAGAAAAGSIGYNCCEGSTGAIPQAPVEVRAAWIPGPPPAMSKRSLSRHGARARSPIGTPQPLHLLQKLLQFLLHVHFQVCVLVVSRRVPSRHD